MCSSDLGMGPVPVRPGSVSTGIDPMHRGPASLEGPPSLLSQQCRRDIRVIPSPPLRAGFGPKTQEYNCHSFDLYISHFHYVQNESDSIENESPRNYRFTRFRRSYIRPDPCTVAGDMGLRSLPRFCLPVFIPHPNMAVLTQFFELREVPHITG